MSTTTIPKKSTGFIKMSTKTINSPKSEFRTDDETSQLLLLTSSLEPASKQPTGTGTIALDPPTFGSFTLLELVSDQVNWFLW
jgi:hypothetical protein